MHPNFDIRFKTPQVGVAVIQSLMLQVALTYVDPQASLIILKDRPFHVIYRCRSRHKEMLTEALNYHSNELFNRCALTYMDYIAEAGLIIPDRPLIMR